jgi:pimeloyl-ACP methyl ester carboxylesterase
VISFAGAELFGNVDAMAAVRTSTIPSLFISAVDDLADTARDFYASSPAPDKQLMIVPGFEHGAPVLEDSTVLAAVDAWIAAHLP